MGRVLNKQDDDDEDVILTQNRRTVNVIYG